MTLDVSSYTDKGGREINEDSILCTDKMFIVADGLGGHDAGEEASAAAVKFIEENCGSDFSEESLIELLEKTNEAVRSLECDALTTVALAVIDNGYFHYANVGDSRVYLFRNNKLFARSKDHSVCQAAVDMGELAYEDIRGSDDRSKLLKVLGNPKPLKLKSLYQPVKLLEGDAFIICSDGFWDSIYETEMEIDLLKSETAEQWMNFMLKRLLLKTNGEGDNYSVICVIVHNGETGVYEAVKKPKCRKGYIIALVIALLAAAGAGAWFHSKFICCKDGTSVPEEGEETSVVNIVPDEPLPEDGSDTSETEGTDVTTLSEEQTVDTSAEDGSVTSGSNETSEDSSSDTSEYGKTSSESGDDTSETDNTDVTTVPEEQSGDTSAEESSGETSVTDDTDAGSDVTTTPYRPWLEPDYSQSGTMDCVRW